MNIFTVRPGVAIAIRDPAAIPAIFAIQGWGGFAARRALINGISLSASDNFNLSHMLRNSIYINVFGERIGDFTVRGLALNGDCLFGQEDGLSRVMDYYRTMRLSSATAPISARYGRFGFAALLVGAQFNLSNPVTGIGEFQFQMKLLPTR